MKRTLVIHPDNRSTDMMGYEAESDGQVAELLIPLMHAMRDTIDMGSPITQYNRYKKRVYEMSCLRVRLYEERKLR